jgi:hypothetical protein
VAEVLRAVFSVIGEAKANEAQAQPAPAWVP